MKLLFLAYYFPPVWTPGNVRRYHFYREAQKYFDDIHVITTSNRRWMATDETLQLPAHHLTEAPAWDLRRLNLGRKPKDPTVPARYKKHPLFHRLRRCTDSFPFNIFLDDGGPVYIHQAYRAGARLVAEAGITHLFSSFRPYADHLVAYRLKKKYPHLYWIADFRDLPVDPIRRNVIWPAVQRRRQRHILRRADLVTAVSEGQKQQLAKLAPRVAVLRNGIGELEEPVPAIMLPDRFTIAYTGSLYPELQQISLLGQALQALLHSRELQKSDFQLIYAGKDGEIWDRWMAAYGLQALSENKGPVSRAKARQIQSRSHLNLLLTWTAPGYSGVLTSKLMEYLAAQREILALVNGPTDPELASLLEGSGAGAIFHQHHSPAALAKWLLKRIMAWKTDYTLISRVDNEKLNPFFWSSQMQNFIDRVVNPG